VIEAVGFDHSQIKDQVITVSVCIMNLNVSNLEYIYNSKGKKKGKVNRDGGIS